jgi:hypothetical protein
MTDLPRKEWAKLFLAWTKETKRETQIYDRDEQESVRVEEQYLVRITISTRSDTYILFLFMFVQRQLLSPLLSFG